MRSLLAALILLAAGCDKEPANTTPPTDGTSKLPPPPAPPDPGADPDQRVRAAPPDALIAFARGPELWVMKPDGSDPTRILQLEAEVAQPAWSPNRKWVAFSSAARGERNLYRRNVFIVRPDGSDLRQVTPMPRSGEDLEHAPKGTLRGRTAIVLETGRLGVEDFDVAVYGRTTIGKTQKGGLFEVYAPIGPSWIKISGMYKGVRYSGSIMQPVREGRATELTRDVLLTPLGADDEAHAPSWSADGRRLYFLLRAPAPRREGMSRASSLYRISLDGANADQVYSDVLATVEAAAVAGESAYVKMRDGRLVRVSLEQRRAVDQWAGGVATPDAVAVGPDGSIAYTRMDSALNTEIVVRGGAGEKIVYTGKASDGRIFALDFSPDGRALVFDRRRVDRSNIFVLDLAGGTARALTSDGASSDPAWYGR